MFEAFLESEFGFSRRFALKRPTAGAKLDVLTAFADEACILSLLEHPGVISIIDFGIHEGLPYQVLEYVDGCDVGALCRRADELGVRIAPACALRLVADAAVALDYVHKAQDRDGRAIRIVHRDVSPSNIIVSRRGEVKVIDFGVAHADTRRTRTSAGWVRGRKLFMSPEQLDRRPVDGRTDVFSLGCVLHYLVTGQSPIVSGDGEHHGVETKLASKIDDDVARIVDKAIRLAPEARFSSARAMAKACVECLQRRGGMGRGDLAEWLVRLKVDETQHSLGAVLIARPPPASPGSPPSEVGRETVLGSLMPGDVEPTVAGPAPDGPQPNRSPTRLDSSLDPHEDRTVMPTAEQRAEVERVRPSQNAYEETKTSESGRDGSTVELPDEDLVRARGLRWPP